MKILMVGGTWNKENGKESGLINKMYQELKKLTKDITFYNGGKYENLEKIIDSASLFDVIFWMANVDNSLPKVRDIKKVNPYAFVIGSKRNDNNKYSFVEVLDRALLNRHNLTIQFSKENTNTFKMLVFDPLGTNWYEGYDLNKCVESIYKRVSFVLTTKRDNTYPTNEEIEIPDNEEFFEYVREVSEIFHKTIEHATGVTRFLGNASFMLGSKDYIYVTRRDVDKRFIDKDHFVGAYLGKDKKTYYSGPYKPSKDTIVQLHLYKKLSNIKYIIHSHCYVENAPFTSIPVPCGALDEITEVMDSIKKDYNNNLELDYYTINLKGHGCLIMGSNVDILKKTKFLTRHLPEKIKEE